MALITVELPSGEMKKLVINMNTTLKEVAALVQMDLVTSMFFGYRYEGELGTLMDYASDALFSTFNTNSCVILDSTNIPAKDQATVTKWLIASNLLAPGNTPSP